MIADLSRVASTIREDGLAARLARLRDEIMNALRAQGYYTIRDGGREFTITVTDRTAARVDPSK